LLQSAKKLEASVGGELVKRLMYSIPLLAVAVLAFAAIAAAQSVPEQSNLEQTSSVDQAQTQDSSGQTAPAETTVPAETPVSVPSNTTTVNIHDHAFDPAQLNIAPGTTVTFVNNDTEPHTATADGLFDTGVIEPGYSLSVFLDGAGTVTYYCELHPDMQGSIVVGGAGGVEGTTPSDQADSAAPTEPSSGAIAPASA
jgi:plastocyanin